MNRNCFTITSSLDLGRNESIGRGFVVMKDLAEEDDVKEHNANRNKEIANLSIFINPFFFLLEFVEMNRKVGS